MVHIVFPAAAKEKLQKLLGDDTDLVIEEEQTTDYECFPEIRSVNPVLKEVYVWDT